MPSSSPKFQIDWTDIWKAFRGMLIVAAGGLVLNAATYLQGAVQGGQVSFGMWDTMAVAVASFIAEMLRRYLSDFGDPKPADATV